MKTDYAGHDARYQELRAAGADGWDSESQLADHVSELAFYDRCAEVPRSGRLLELGCGAGDIALLYAARGFDVSGVDISPTAVEWARDKATQRGLAADFHVGDVLALEHADSSFDVVLDGHCFHCIIGADRARFLAEAKRVLRPDGALLIGTMCGEITSERILEAFDPQTRCFMRGDTATRYIGEPDALLNELRVAGLNVVAWEVKPRLDQDDQDTLLVVATGVASG